MSSDDSLAQALIDRGYEMGYKMGYKAWMQIQAGEDIDGDIPDTPAIRSLIEAAKKRTQSVKRGVLAMYRDGVSLESIMRYTNEPEEMIRAWISESEAEK